jgi:hypothetical protein
VLRDHWLAIECSAILLRMDKRLYLLCHAKSSWEDPTLADHDPRLSFPIVAGQIGVQLHLLRPAVYAALVAVGLLSVLLFPLAALTLLRAAEKKPRDVVEPAR